MSSKVHPDLGSGTFLCMEEKKKNYDDRRNRTRWASRHGNMSGWDLGKWGPSQLGMVETNGEGQGGEKDWGRPKQTDRSLETGEKPSWNQEAETNLASVIVE
ncbi:unnamed protein product [Aspergillus oryzae]|uniref:Unnamed protein product n=1 Tax=Aspergillus oryzae TaxID=5062 RepID=A0AAN4YKM8_ASPOZ|nr:unnamed protein product [Aspergillus oryzae]GMG29561.1 unnamed protein product [Aspergillus oryzae]